MTTGQLGGVPGSVPIISARLGFSGFIVEYIFPLADDFNGFWENNLGYICKIVYYMSEYYYISYYIYISNS